MKKFFSLLCATLLVFSASAAPVAKKAEIAKKAPVAVEQMQKVQFEKAQSVKTLSLENAQLSNQLSATPALKVSNQKAEASMAKNNRLMANHQAAPAKPAVRKAANAVAEDINVTATSVYASDYSGYLDYYMYVEGGTYDFSGIAPVEGKTYTLADMDPDYTGWYANEDEGYITTKATAATLTVSKKNGLPYVVGTMTIGGDNYTITYELKLTDTVTVNATNLAVKSPYYGGYEYMFNDADWTFDIVDFDMTAKTGTLANIDFDYSCVYPTGGSSWDAFYFAAVVEDVVVAQDADTLKLTGSIAAENGTLYVLNARYEKPDAKEITLVADTLNFFTKMLSAGYYQMQGYTVDSTYEFSFYFISKSLSGNYTEEDMDAYSTWVDQKDGKKTVVSYQNLSAANIKASLVNDTLYYTGTMTLATNDGQEANITLNLSCPFKQEWGEWADFAPFGFNTGKYYFNLFGATQAKAAVQVRKDNTGLKQYKITNWGANMFTANGVELMINVDGDNVCTLKPTYTGYPQDPYYAITDYYTFTGSAQGSSTFDPENGKFTFKAVYFNGNTGQGLSSITDSLVMDKPILERDTVTVTADMKLLAEPANGIIKVSAEFNDTTFTLEVVGADTVGTFSLADGTLSQKYYYGIASDAGRSDFAEGEVTIAKNETGLKLNGLMIGVDEKAYVLDWTYTPITERDTVDIISNTMTYNDFIASNQAVQFYAGEDAVGYSTFLVTSKNATSVEGTFDIYVGYSFANPDEGDQISFEEGKITVASEEKGIRLTGWVIGDNEKYYRLNWYKQTVFDERDTVYVNSNTLDAFYQGSINGYVYQSSNTDYELIQFVTKSSEKLGTFAVADLQYGYSYLLVHETDQTAVLFQDGEITVSEDEAGLKLTGTLIGKDEKAYVFNLVQPVGVLEKDTDAPFEAEFAYTEMTADIVDGVISISAQKGTELALELILFTDPANEVIPAGVYTISDSQEAGTALQSIGYAQGANPCFAATLVVQEDKLYLDDMWFIVEGTVTLSYDEYDKLKVVVDAKNSYGQPVTALIAYEKIEPKSTVTITDGELAIDEEMYAQYGITTYIVENDNYGFILPVYADTIVGDFTEDLEYALAKVVNLASLAPSNIIDVESIVVTGIEKNITLNAKVLGADTIMYEITATGYYGYIQGDAVEGYVGEFAVEDITFSQQKAKKLVTLSGTNAKGDMLTIIVQGTTLNNENKLAAGTYENIQASTGWDEDNQVTPSFVGNNAGVWFIQGGELVVNEDGSMAFLGVNSYDATIEIGFTVPTPEVTDYYLVGWINNAAYGIEGDIDNFGDYHFVAGEDGALKVKATFNELSYVQVKDNNKQIYGTESYVAPVNVGNALLFKTGTEKIAINGGAEYEYTLTVYEDGTLEIFYEEVTTDLRNAKANVKAAKQIKNGQIVIVRENKEYNILGTAL